MPTASPPISSVSDTARWVAFYRAMETERPDALFDDPWARRLAGVQGEEIVRRLPKGRALAWPVIVRTAVMDELIERAVDRDRVDTVVNLASGLDTRPFRLAVPASLRWFDVDLPGVLEAKRAVLDAEAPRCRVEFLPADLADPAARSEVLDRVQASATRALVITEGLLIYLTREGVTGLARDLHRREAIRWWLTDLASPRLMEILAKTWARALKAGNAPLQFAPAEGTAFFETLGWGEHEFRSTWEESLRLGRTMRLAWFWNLLGRFSPKQKQEEMRRMSGIVLFERRGEAT